MLFFILHISLTFPDRKAAIAMESNKQGLDKIAAEEQRLAEAEETVQRLMQKVAKETEAVQKAVDDLERANRESRSGSDRAVDLKKGGIVKQAAFVGTLLFGSRALTEVISAVGNSNGGDHTMSALLQGVIALACAVYFFLVK
jgi:hypothetical protein